MITVFYITIIISNSGYNGSLKINIPLKRHSNAHTHTPQTRKYCHINIVCYGWQQFLAFLVLCAKILWVTNTNRGLCEPNQTFSKDFSGYKV